MFKRPLHLLLIIVASTIFVLIGVQPSAHVEKQLSASPAKPGSLTNNSVAISYHIAPKPAKGPTVRLSVDATGAPGDTLTFQWRTTDGTLQTNTGTQVNWTLPPGPGLHFAYVLVSNGKGASTERRIAVSTDAIGSPPSLAPTTPTSLAPPAQSNTVNFFRSWVITLAQVGGPNGSVATIPLPGASVFLRDFLTGAALPTVLTNSKGQYLSKGGVTTDLYDVFCSVDGVNFSRCEGGTPGPFAASKPGANSFIDILTMGNSTTRGILTLSDGQTPCGGTNEFFGKSIPPSATLLDRNGNVISDGRVTFTPYGLYVGASPSTTIFSVVFHCDGLTQTVSGSGDTSTALPSTAPVVNNMQAFLKKVQVGIFLPPPSGLPSDVVPRADQFLSFKGEDTRLSACLYYKSIGAVTNCSAAGDLIGGTTFDQWKRATGMAPYTQPGGNEVQATYVNLVDLNLTRNHHSVTYGPDHTAAYVCNHLGPKNETQAEVDRVVDDAVAGRNLVACVAMDYLVHPGANNNQPFVRFMIFGPSGELLPSINLDGRREKFVPAVCVPCHGGDRYANSFPTDGSGEANIGAHFLPYDSGNFAFSSKPGLTELDQQQAIHALNQYVLATNATTATQNLVQGWYASGTDVLNKDYVPSSWAAGNPVDIELYKKVVSRSCRTCHVAMADYTNFDEIGAFRGSPGPVVSTFCRPGLSYRAYQMPNSLVTFNRFWNSTDQQKAINDWLTFYNINPTSCTLSGPTLH